MYQQFTPEQVMALMAVFAKERDEKVKGAEEARNSAWRSVESGERKHQLLNDFVRKRHPKSYTEYSAAINYPNDIADARKKLGL